MGSVPALSILKGPFKPLREKNEPLLLHQIFEHTIQSLESINNNNDKISTAHGITVREGEPCLIFGDNRLPLYQFNEHANQLARAIQGSYAATANSDGDTVIAVDLPPSFELVTTLLAIWKLGAAYLPLDAAFPDQRVRHILSESRPALVIAHSTGNKERYEGSPAVAFKTLQDQATKQSGENLPSESHWGKKVLENDQIAIILYTSGSTGVPKGVRLPHRVILNRLKWQWRTMPYSDTENVCLFKTSLTFVDSVAEMWGPLMWGRSLLILTKPEVVDIESFIWFLDQYKIERVVLVPTLLRSLLLYIGMVTNEKTPFRSNEKVQTKKHLSSLKYCISSGESLPVVLAQKFYQFFPASEHTLVNLYGSTEVMADVLYYPVQGIEAAAASDKVAIGRPLDNTNIYLLDKQFRPVNNGEVGELYVSGSNVAAGYASGRDPDKFIDNPITVDSAHIKMYRTGDYARIIKGIVYYEGRTDSQIKIRGHKVDLSEVEAAIGKIQAVDKSVVLCYKTGQIDQALLAFVTIKDPDAVAKDVEEQLGKLLPPYMVPQVVVVQNIPLLVNGKVDRQNLLKQYEENIKEECHDESNFDYTDIPSQHESKAKALFETIAATLKHSLKTKITAMSNFFHLGGNSLNAVLAVTTLRDLGYVISVGEFIGANNLLEVILRMHEEEATSGISLVQMNQIPTGKYRVEPLNDRHKEDTIRIITDSFYDKAEIESFLAPDIFKHDYRELINAIWEPMLAQGLSFAVKNGENQVLAVCLNMDLHAEPEVSLTSKLTVVFDFLEYLEGPFRDNVLPKGIGQVVHSFMMGTSASVPAQQNVELILFMENENLRLSRSRGYAGIFTTNTSPLTQQLGTDVLGYQVLLDYQINKYVAADNFRPFGAADHTYRAVVSWKSIE